MITALWLRDELNEQEFEIVDKYIKKMYKKFLQSNRASGMNEQGFYAMANLWILSILALLASWANDKELETAEEILTHAALFYSRKQRHGYSMMMAT